MTSEEIKVEIMLIVDQLPEKVLIDVLEHLKKLQSHSYDMEIVKRIVSENAELLRRLAD